MALNKNYIDVSVETFINEAMDATLKVMIGYKLSHLHIAYCSVPIKLTQMRQQ